MKHVTTQFILASLSLLIGITLLEPSSGAQEKPTTTQCSEVTLVCPNDCPKRDEDTIVRAIFKGGEIKYFPKMSWSVSEGTIVAGQGTDTLVVRFDNYCESMTITLEVEGSSPRCVETLSCTTITDCCSRPIARKFDEFGDINCEDEMARLDMFANELNNNPGASGYVMFYGGRKYHGRKARRGESEARASRIVKYLVTTRGLEPGRIASINGGFREDWRAELWLAPLGARAPSPTPTINANEIKFRTGKVKSSEYKCGV